METTTHQPGRGSGGGPKTEEGKRRVSLNALKHGFTAAAPHALEVLDFEPGVEFEPILEKAQAYFRPANRYGGGTRPPDSALLVEARAPGAVGGPQHRAQPLQAASGPLRLRSAEVRKAGRSPIAPRAPRFGEDAKMQRDLNQQNKLRHAQPTRKFVFKQPVFSSKTNFGSYWRCGVCSPLLGPNNLSRNICLPASV